MGHPSLASDRSRCASRICVANGAFGNYQMPTQTYSPPVTPAGEAESNTVFTYEFSFISTVTTYQPGLNVSVSPDDGSGGRMLRVDLMTSDQRSCGNSTWCVVLAVADAPTDAVPFGYPVTHDLAWLDPAKPHTIKVSMKLNHGLDNDLVRISIDDQDSGQCFTSGRTTTALSSPTFIAEPPRSADNLSSAPECTAIYLVGRWLTCSTM